MQRVKFITSVVMSDTDYIHDTYWNFEYRLSLINNVKRQAAWTWNPCILQHRLAAEKKLRQDFEDKHEQLVVKLNFDARQYDQVFTTHLRYVIVNK